MKKKSIGHDITFDPHMSVSLIYAYATDDERAAILAAHRRVVEMSKFIYDGMGRFPTELRDVFDIVIEPGAKVAPFQGLTTADLKKHLKVFGKTGSGMTRHHR